MLWKPFLIFSLSLIAFDLRTPQLKLPGDRSSASLPQELTESETQKILRESSPRPHVDATLKVSNERLDSAQKYIEQSQYQSASQDIDIYSSLIVYADAYTRNLPAPKIKDRNHCLKKIEQAVFKKTRTIDAMLREFPIEYREPVERRIDQVKKIRLRAINDVLGDGKMIKTSGDD